jgi:hypothetical protein
MDAASRTYSHTNHVLYMVIERPRETWMQRTFGLDNKRLTLPFERMVSHFGHVAVSVHFYLECDATTE